MDPALLLRVVIMIASPEGPAIQFTLAQVGLDLLGFLCAYLTPIGQDESRIGMAFLGQHPEPFS